MEGLFEKIADYHQKGIDVIIVTVTEKIGSGPVTVGKKMIVASNGEAFGTVGGGKLEYYAREKCKELFKSRTHLTEKYILNDKKEVFHEDDEKVLGMACGGKITLFYEFVGPRAYVYIFGAGHVGQALAKVIKPLGFYVVIIDDRHEVIEKFTNYDEKHEMNFVEYVDKYSLRDDSFVVVCTPAHTYDFHVLNKILEMKLHPKYFGMLCSKTKIQEYLDKAYERFGKDINLSNFYSPIGLNIGGQSPEDIAISISGEMIAVLHEKKDVKHLRETLDDNFKYW